MSVHDVGRADPASAGEVVERKRARDTAGGSEAQPHDALVTDPIGDLARGFSDIITVIQQRACILENSHEPSDPRRQDATAIRIASASAAELTQQLLMLRQHIMIAPRPTLTGMMSRAAVPVAEIAIAPRKLEGNTVLVVDDDPTLRRMLTRLLRRASFEVVDVDSGRGALAALESTHFDVILSDIHMPDGNGLDLLRSVRRIDLDIPVILMSGKPDIESAATALEFGAFRYLIKPLESEAVEKVVRNAARAHALARIRREAMALTGGGEPGAADRAGLEVRFDLAIENLWMAFQPIVEARTGALFGVEALMRSREPSIASPAALLDAATQLKRLPVLGRRTRNLAGAALATRADIPSLFINLHPDDLLDADLIDESAPLTRIASRVILEVTEREALKTTPALIARLERLRALGFRLAVDDIGAGYSGLTSFAELTPEIVKIDMALVRSIHASAVKQRTVGALCTLCHEMGTLVVGEGVETEDERDCLLAIGCDLFQGYLIARPSCDLPPPS